MGGIAALASVLSRETSPASPLVKVTSLDKFCQFESSSLPSLESTAESRPGRHTKKLEYIESNHTNYPHDYSVKICYSYTEYHSRFL